MSFSSRRRSGWLLVSCAAFALLCAGGPTRAQPAGPFAEATAAFEAGDFARALDLFEEARRRGADTPALGYNIGVCQYRVGDYEAAAATFATLARRFPSLTAIADYNRGLALLRLERREEARAAFAAALAAGDGELAALAGAALAEIAEPTRPQPPAPRWAGYFDTVVGHDDNVALVADIALPTTAHASSGLVELVGYAGRSFERVRLDFSGYFVRYPSASLFDQDALRVDGAFPWSAGAWRFEAGPHVAQTELDGDVFERGAGATFFAARGLGAGFALDLRASYDDLATPAERYAYAEGTRERLRVRLERRNATGRWRLGYEVERNDRASASVSADRERLAFDIRRTLRERWSLDATLAYRESRYAELVPVRVERLAELGVAGHHDLSRGWRLNLEYRFLDNDSDVPEFGYRSHRAGFGFDKSF